jgi:hypothetical protein
MVFIWVVRVARTTPTAIVTVGVAAATATAVAIIATMICLPQPLRQANHGGYNGHRHLVQLHWPPYGTAPAASSEMQLALQCQEVRSRGSLG